MNRILNDISLGFRYYAAEFSKLNRNRLKTVGIVVLSVFPEERLKSFENQRGIKVPRANPGAARLLGRARRGAIPGCPTPGGQRSPARGAGAGAAIGAVHTRSADAGEWLKNIGKPKDKLGVPQDPRGHRGALPQWGTMHDARCPPRSEGRRHACGTRTPERAVVPAPDCTKACKKTLHFTGTTLISKNV